MMTKYTAWRKPTVPNPGPCTYFLLCEAADQIRIGRTKDAIVRMQHHQRANGTPVVLLAITWDYGRERVLHEQLAALQSHGEWFWIAPAVTAAMCEHADTEPATLDLITAINTDGERYYWASRGGYTAKPCRTTTWKTRKTLKRRIASIAPARGSKRLRRIGSGEGQIVSR